MTKIIKKTLRDLIDDLPVTWESSSEIKPVPINSIQFDSRKVKPGDLFVAMTGEFVDGHDYIQTAIERGAAAVVGTKDLTAIGVLYIRVPDSREALAWLAASWYDHPGRKLTVIGVTGTDGKTTTCNLIYQVLKTAGIKTGMVSTVNAIIGDEVMDTGFHVTTPEATDIQRYLSLMVEAGLTHVILETTSHGLAQNRVTGCEYDIAVVTNITHEHLDYHGSYEAYREAKTSMFHSLTATAKKTCGNPRLAIINADDQSYEFLKEQVEARKLSYGLEGDWNLHAASIRSSSNGLDFTAIGEGISFPVHCNLPGNYNVSNCLAALCATVLGLKINPLLAARGISMLPGVPGRMEWIDLGQDFTAIVDFAHTPNALKSAIETARQMTSGKVITVFGSAGLRDRKKRRLMAEESVRSADITILTAEDPRTESLDAILAQMADAAEQAGGTEGKTFYRVADRGDAIRLALTLAKTGDLVMACGKGHEQSMCFEMTEYAWDDRLAMRAALSELLGLSGPGMPELPTSKK